MTPKVQDVSFVVIARNEQDRLCRCLDSITRLDMVNCEVICVDSLSTDKTLDVMMAYEVKYPFFIVLSPSKCLNAAAARNHGMRKASKTKIFFVDGDIELNPKFVQAALEELKSLKVSAVVGGLDEIQYSDSTKKPIRPPYVRHRYEHRIEEMICGGSFIAKTEAVRSTGYFDERFFRNQDGDYTLRFTSKFTMVALPLLMGIHHTGEYRERAWLFFRKGYVLNHGMLARKHARRAGFWRYWIRGRKTLLWGFVVDTMLFLSIVLYLCGVLSWTSLAIFIVGLLSYEVVYSVFKAQSLSATLVKGLLWPYGVFLGFFFEPFIGGAGQKIIKKNRRPGSIHMVKTMLKNRIVKMGVQKIIGIFPSSIAFPLNEIATKRVRGNVLQRINTIERANKCLCNLRLLQEHTAFNIRGANILELGTGWHGVDIILFYLMGAAHIITVDHWTHLRVEAMKDQIMTLHNERDSLCLGSLCSASDAFDRLNILVTKVQGNASLSDLITELNVSFLIFESCDVTKINLPQESIDLFYTESVLQRIPTQVLCRILTHVGNHLMSVNSVFFARTDQKDIHTQEHVDSDIWGLEYLKYSDRFWRLVSSEKLNWQNRLRESDFVKLFEKNNMDVVYVLNFRRSKFISIPPPIGALGYSEGRNMQSLRPLSDREWSL